MKAALLLVFAAVIAAVEWYGRKPEDPAWRARAKLIASAGIALIAFFSYFEGYLDRLRGECYFAQARYVEAALELESAHDKGWDSAESFNKLVVSLKKVGEQQDTRSTKKSYFGRAFKLADDATPRYPCMPKLRNHVVNLARRMDEWSEAKEHLEKLLGDLDGGRYGDDVCPEPPGPDDLATYRMLASNFYGDRGGGANPHYDASRALALCNEAEALSSSNLYMLQNCPVRVAEMLPDLSTEARKEQIARACTWTTEAVALAETLDSDEDRLFARLNQLGLQLAKIECPDGAWDEDRVVAEIERLVTTADYEDETWLLIGQVYLEEPPACPFAQKALRRADAQDYDAPEKERLDALWRAYRNGCKA